MGVCTTGNSLDKHDIDDYHMEQNDASVKYLINLMAQEIIVN